MYDKVRSPMLPMLNSSHLIAVLGSGSAVIQFEVSVLAHGPTGSDDKCQVVQGLADSLPRNPGARPSRGTNPGGNHLPLRRFI